MRELKVVEGWSTGLQSNPDYRNVWVDCPHCHREECFTMLAVHQQVVVRCESGSAKDTAGEYILCYPHPK